jgi:hypothetical protein
MSLSMLHRIAQHCLCDEIGHIELRDIAGIWDEDDSAPSVYSAIALDAARAISAELAFRPYDRAGYEAQKWAIRDPSLRL